MRVFEKRWRDRQWQAAALLVAITAIGALLRFWQIGHKSLWIDEAFSVWMARQPVGEGLQWLVQIDQHPPLYYLLLHLWIRLGDDPATVRSLSAVVSTLNIPVVYGLGRQLIGRKGGLLAAALVSVSPFQIRFAQEARMYALLSVMASLAMWALAHLLADRRDLARRGRRERIVAWAGYVLAVAGALWTHNTAVLLWGTVNLVVFGMMWLRARRPASGDMLTPPSLRAWGMAQGAVALLWLPWVSPFVRQSAAVYRSFWIPAPTWSRVLGTVQSLCCAFLPQRIGWPGAIWAGYGLLLLAGAFGLRKRPGVLLALAVLIVAPLGGEWLISLQRPILYDRTLIWTTVPLSVLLAAGILQLRYRSFVLAAMAAWVTVCGLSVREYYVRFEKEAWDEAAAYVAARAKEEELILYHATWVQIPFDYYLEGENLSLQKHGVPVDLFDRGVLEPKMRAEDRGRIAELVEGRERVWLVYSHQWWTDPQGLVLATLQEHLDLVRRRRFYGLEVRLYQARGEQDER
jgi:hypothetical protein